LVKPYITYLITQTPDPSLKEEDVGILNSLRQVFSAIQEFEHGTRAVKNTRYASSSVERVKKREAKSLERDLEEEEEQEF